MYVTSRDAHWLHDIYMLCCVFIAGNGTLLKVHKSFFKHKKGWIVLDWWFHGILITDLFQFINFYSIFISISHYFFFFFATKQYLLYKGINIYKICNDYNKNKKWGKNCGLKSFVHMFTLQTQLFTRGKKCVCFKACIIDVLI